LNLTKKKFFLSQKAEKMTFIIYRTELIFFVSLLFLCSTFAYILQEMLYAERIIFTKTIIYLIAMQSRYLISMFCKELWEMEHMSIFKSITFFFYIYFFRCCDIIKMRNWISECGLYGNC